MPERLSIEDLLARGVKFAGKIMDVTHELRIRTTYEGVSVSITQVPEDAPLDWQGGHFHKGQLETYVVVKGAFVLAELYQGRQQLIPCGVGATITVQPLSEHTLLVEPGSIFVTIKYGDPIGNPGRKGDDWWEADVGFTRWIDALIPAAVMAKQFGHQ